MKTIALALPALAALAAATFAAPAAAALPCRDLTMPVTECVTPLSDRLEHLCFPPDASDPYGC